MKVTQALPAALLNLLSWLGSNKRKEPQLLSPKTQLWQKNQNYLHQHLRIRVSCKKRSQNKVAKEIEQGEAQQGNSPSLRQAKNINILKDQINVDCKTKVPIASPCSLLATEANGEIWSAITQGQEKARIEANENDEMWGRNAKAVDIAMATETLGRIDRDQVKYIINMILKRLSPNPQ